VSRSGGSRRNALGLSLSSVNSALHRARETVGKLGGKAEEPTPERLRIFMRAWEEHDLDALVALLREDVELAMPPYAVWFRGVEAVKAFFQTPRFAAFWSAGVHPVPLHANGAPSFAFYRAAESSLTLHAIMVTRFRAGLVAEMTVFIGPTYFSSFHLPLAMDRTVWGPWIVMGGGEKT
jgi:RNA polymerase sigma-70 factor (ECF subfamily)